MSAPTREEVLEGLREALPAAEGIGLVSASWAIRAAIAYLEGQQQTIEELRLECACKEGVLAMAVARLGGTVEGAPTHRGNFLQRIDELRRLEREAKRALRKVVGVGEFLEHRADTAEALAACRAALGGKP